MKQFKSAKLRSEFRNDVIFKQCLYAGVHLIIMIITITVIVQKQSVSVIAERSPSNCSNHSKNFQDHIFWHEIKISMN